MDVRRWFLCLSLPLLACPAGDDAAGVSTGSSGSVTDPTGSTPTEGPVSATVDPDTGPSTLTDGPTTDGPTTQGESTTSSETGEPSPVCEVMLPPAEQCPFKARARPSIGVAGGSPVGGFDLDDYAQLPDEAAGGGDFIQDPDAGGGEECDIWAQNCPLGEKCMPWADDGGSAWNATRCSPLDPTPDGVGDPCTVEGSGVSGIDSCGLGELCWDVDNATSTGTCIELCSCDPEFPVCATPNTACAITNGGVLPVCLPVCNPLDPTACSQGQGCYPGGGLFQCAPDASGSSGAVGEGCDFLNGCDPGNFCGTPACDGAGGCCTPFCTLDDVAPCDGGAECVPFYEQGGAPDECLATVGVCL